MGVLDKVLGPVMNLVDRKHSWEMGRFRRMHQWPIVFASASVALGVFLGFVEGGAEKLSQWGLTQTQLAEYVAAAAIFLGGYILTILERRAGRDQPVVADDGAD